MGIEFADARRDDMTPYGNSLGLSTMTANTTANLPQMTNLAATGSSSQVAGATAGIAPGATPTTGATPLGGDTPDEALQAGRDYVQWGGTALQRFDQDIQKRSAAISAAKASGTDSGEAFDSAKRKLDQREQLRDMLAGHLQRMQHILSDTGSSSGEDSVAANAIARSAEQHAAEVAADQRMSELRRAEASRRDMGSAAGSGAAIPAPLPDPALVAARYQAR